MSCGNAALDVGSLGIAPGVGALTKKSGGGSNPYGAVGGAYLQDLNAYAAGAPEQLELQKEYQPQYTALNLQNMDEFLNGRDGQPGYLAQYQDNIVPAITAAANTANTSTRAAGVADITNLGPQALAALKAANPGGSALQDSLTKTATDQLALGTQLDPNTVNQINQSVGANWASRGLGASNAAELDQAMQYNTNGQALLSAREGEAGSVASMDQNYYTNPVLSLLGVGGTGAVAGLPAASTTNQLAGGIGPTMFSNADATSLFSGAYNANAMASASKANNNAALCGSGISGGASLAGTGILAEALA